VQCLSTFGRLGIVHVVFNSRKGIVVRSQVIIELVLPRARISLTLLMSHQLSPVMLRQIGNVLGPHLRVHRLHRHKTVLVDRVESSALHRLDLPVFQHCAAATDRCPLVVERLARGEVHLKIRVCYGRLDKLRPRSIDLVSLVIFIV